MFYKIKSVEILNNMELKIEFVNGNIKYYDVKKLVEKFEQFKDLLNVELFKKVKVEKGGYGISWNENIDISCNELWFNSYKKGIIISAFAGLGKTTLANKYTNILDLESTNYHWIFEKESRENLTNEELKGVKSRKLNEEWPQNYIKKILEAQREYDIILITASEEIRNILVKNNIDFIFAFPKSDSLQEIINRCIKRNNNEEFIEGIKEAFYKWQKDLENYNYKVILVDKDEYLEDSLKRNLILS